MSTDRRAPVSIGERWRRLSTTEADSADLDKALASLPNIRQPRIRIQPGAIQADLEGTMGSINEVSVHVPRLPQRIWPQVVRVLRRSASMQEALRAGRVPRSFDRLIARVAGEAVVPEPRRVTSACTCGQPQSPCQHILALHELFARLLDERPWEILMLRGVDLRGILRQAGEPIDENLPPLAFGAREEPILFPEGEKSDLDSVLTPGQVRHLVGGFQSRKLEAVADAIRSYATADTAGTAVAE